MMAEVGDTSAVTGILSLVPSMTDGELYPFLDYKRRYYIFLQINHFYLTIISIRFLYDNL